MNTDSIDTGRPPAREPTAGILILNWNGRELLREHLPSVVAAAAHSRLPVAVADNGSSDGSLEYLAAEHPHVIRIPLGRNHGFGRGYNLAMRQVPWDVVILLNNDMTVAPDFAGHLLAPFADDPGVFAVSAQVFLQDPQRRREETGRTSARLRHGELQCAHLPLAARDRGAQEGTAPDGGAPLGGAPEGAAPDSGAQEGTAPDGGAPLGGAPEGSSDGGLQPVFWLGGGSAAVSHEKFDALGGFEELYSPFYMEDVDLSFRAWQRGWRTLLAPRSHVTHRHRGTTGRLDPQIVETIVARNRILFVWLNVRDRRLLLQHLARLAAAALRPGRGGRTSRRALLAALKLLPAVRRRRGAASGPVVMTDTEVLALFARDWEQLGGPAAGGSPTDMSRAGGSPTRVSPATITPTGQSAGGASPGDGAGGVSPAHRRPLRLLFVVPTSVYPVSHGGASRITNTIWGLSRRGHEVHVFSLVDTAAERAAMCAMPEVASSHAVVLPPERRYLPGSTVPIAIRRLYRPSAHRHIADLIRRYDVDIVELEYTQAGAYLSPALDVPTVLVEHDLAYRSAIRSALQRPDVLRKARWLIDAARFYRWEIAAAKKADLVLTASEQEAQILRRHGVSRVSGAVPNGVDVARFEPPGARQEDRDILFVGFFGHTPNVEGLEFFVSSIWPHLRADRSGLSVTIVGPGLTPDLAAKATTCGFRLPGFVADLTAELWSHRVFVCPIRWGAGTRIKLLEAAAAKCAIVSTTVGAEGLGLRDGVDVLIADDPADFAFAVLRLLDDPALRARLGESAHDTIQRQFDWPVLVGNLEQLYYRLLGAE